MGDARETHPIYTTRPSGRPVPGAMEWLKQHWDEYAGRWVAVGPDGLVADGATFDEIRRQLPSLKGVLIAQLV